MTLTLYLSTLAGNHIEAEDGLRYVNDITSGDPARISFPYHLLYGWLGRVTLTACSALGVPGDPLVQLQVLNAVVGALGIATLWWVLRAVVPGARSRSTAAAACGVTAVSYGYWWYSVEVEVYVVAAFVMIGSLWLAHRAARRGTTGSFVLLGVGHGIAVLAHITNVFAGVLAIVALLAAHRGRPVAAAVRSGLGYLGAAAAVVLPAYLAAIIASGLRGRAEIVAWFAEYPRLGEWGNADAATLPKALLGAGRALVGGHSAYAFATVQAAVARALPGSDLREETYLVRHVSPLLAAAVSLLAVVVFLALLALATGWLKRPALSADARLLAGLCIAWVLPYAAFVSWWEPENSEFWISTWIPIAVLLALPLSAPTGPRSTSTPRTAVLVLVPTLFLANLVGSVLPQHDAANDYWRARYAWFEQAAGPNDIILAGDYIGANYLDYYTPAHVVRTGVVFAGETDGAIIEQQLTELARRTGARRVLISSTVFAMPTSSLPACDPDDACAVPAVMRSVLMPHSRILEQGPLDEVVWEWTAPVSDDSRD